MYHNYGSTSKSNYLTKVLSILGVQLNSSFDLQVFDRLLHSICLQLSEFEIQPFSTNSHAEFNYKPTKPIRAITELNLRGSGTLSVVPGS